MASLQEIKGRLGSITTTKKITKAMELVSTAKLKKVQKHYEGLKEYTQSVSDLFQQLLQSVEDTSDIYPKNAEDKTLYIVVTSDLGLCAGYNSNVFKKLKKEFRLDHDKMITLGSKAAVHFDAPQYNTLEKYTSIGDEPNFYVTSEITKEVIGQFQSGEVSKVKIIYTKFINSVTYEATSAQLLPIEKADGEVQTIEADFEPDAQTVIKSTLPLYVSAMVYGILAESKVSEMSSRRTAMESATDNAEELIDKLEIEFNRARQAAITQEINEIVAGAGSD